VLFGREGVPHLADALGLPCRTWLNYEAGVIMPATVILRFVELTGANPSRLLKGHGPMFVGEVTPLRPGRPSPAGPRGPLSS
jgi:hypothetical protein